MAKIDIRSAGTAQSPQSAAQPSDHGDVQATDADRGVPNVQKRLPRRSVAASVTALGAAVSIGALNPMLPEIAAMIALVVALTILGTALFGNTDFSDRAFRLLRWIRNRPEPPAPEVNNAGRRTDHVGQPATARPAPYA